MPTFETLNTEEFTDEDSIAAVHCLIGCDVSGNGLSNHHFIFPV
jgi:hypothetical protein